MKRFALLLLLAGSYVVQLGAQESLFEPAAVDFDAYENLMKEVKEHRKTHLVNLDQFLKMSQEKNVIILDTRSDSMYNAKHVKGAKHLDFSNFTQATLEKVIASPDTKILIYCNNNFSGDEYYLPTKSYSPKKIRITDQKLLTLALNIPTYINLYGYGYKNVYELSELVSVDDERISFGGTTVGK